MFDRIPILVPQTLEEVVQTQVIAEDENSIFLALSDNWRHFAENLTVHSEDAIVAELISGYVLAAVTESVCGTLRRFGCASTWVDGLRSRNIRPYLQPNF